MIRALHLPLLAALALALTCPVSLAERVAPRPQALTDAGPARVIVKFKAGAASQREQALSAGATARASEERAAMLGARLGLTLKAGPALAERLQVIQAAGGDARALAARLAREADVEYAEPDRRVRRLALPNDPRFAGVAGPRGPAAGQWHLRTPSAEAVSAIDAVAAWDVSTGSANVVVAVLDTGVRMDHPDLAGKLLPGYDMVSDPLLGNDGDGRDGDASDPGDWIDAGDTATSTFKDCEVSASSWHGTQVAGIVGAATDNGIGMAGAGWNVRVLPVRVLGKCFGNLSDIVAGIRWAAGLPVPGLPLNPNPARVINLSLGSSEACSASERDAIAAANAAGAVVVVAAGNTVGLAAGSPANCPGAIGVAALRHVGTKVGFSDVGPELSIAAPGGNCVNIGAGEPCLYPILTTSDSGVRGPAQASYTDSFDISVGTSFSAPLVSATAALMLSAQPGLTPGGVRAAMQATARPFPASGVEDDPDLGAVRACHAPNGSEQLQCYCSTSTCGAGMLDAGAAVRAAVGGHVLISVAPGTPTAGQTLTLSSAGSMVASGHSIVGWAWTLVGGGGVVSAIDGASNAASAALTPTAAGSFTVRLTLTDERGISLSAQQTIVVVAAAPPPITQPVAQGGGGGGATSWVWILALGLATLLLAWPVAPPPQDGKQLQAQPDNRLS